MSVFVIVLRHPGARSTMADGEVTKDGKEPMETGFVLSEIDTMTPHPARKYDTLPGAW
jgi:hypothetical protein